MERPAEVAAARRQIAKGVAALAAAVESRPDGLRYRTESSRRWLAGPETAGDRQRSPDTGAGSG